MSQLLFNDFVIPYQLLLNVTFFTLCHCCHMIQDGKSAGINVNLLSCPRFFEHLKLNEIVTCQIEFFYLVASC